MAMYYVFVISLTKFMCARQFEIEKDRIPVIRVFFVSVSYRIQCVCWYVYVHICIPYDICITLECCCCFSMLIFRYTKTVYTQCKSITCICPTKTAHIHNSVYKWHTNKETNNGNQNKLVRSKNICSFMYILRMIETERH